jgi:hypothetical protein
MSIKIKHNLKSITSLKTKVLPQSGKSKALINHWYLLNKLSKILLKPIMIYQLQIQHASDGTEAVALLTPVKVQLFKTQWKHETGTYH